MDLLCRGVRWALEGVLLIPPPSRPAWATSPPSSETQNAVGSMAFSHQAYSPPFITRRGGGRLSLVLFCKGCVRWEHLRAILWSVEFCSFSLQYFPWNLYLSPSIKGPGSSQ